MASKITFVNNGSESCQVQNHRSGYFDVAAGATYELVLDPAKDIATQAFLKKFYNQYKALLEIEYDIADYPLDLDYEPATVAAEAQDVLMFGTPVSDLQAADVKVNGDAITGTLKYLATGALVDRWEAGNFLALKFDWEDARITDVKVGLVPSASGMELQSIFDDPDRDGAWKISDKASQKFVVETYVGDSVVNRQELDLSGLTLNAEVTSAPAPKKAAADAGVDVVEEPKAAPAAKAAKKK